MFCDDPFLFLFAGDSIKQDSFYQKDKIKNKPDFVLESKVSVY